MKHNPLKQLETLGQSIWLDYIRRDLIAGGRLRRLIEEDGLRGMTSNPALFEKTIADSHDYDEEIQALTLEGKDAGAIYEALSQHDEFRPLYDRTDVWKARGLDLVTWFYRKIRISGTLPGGGSNEIEAINR